jgi:hypothetical protein
MGNSTISRSWKLGFPRWISVAATTKPKITRQTRRWKIDVTWQGMILSCPEDSIKFYLFKLDLVGHQLHWKKLKTDALGLIIYLIIRGWFMPGPRCFSGFWRLDTLWVVEGAISIIKLLQVTCGLCMNLPRYSLLLCQEFVCFASVGWTSPTPTAQLPILNAWDMVTGNP